MTHECVPPTLGSFSAKDQPLAATRDQLDLLVHPCVAGPSERNETARH